MGLYKRPIFCYNLNCSEENMALWCSRLARQPVTLEVDGSSPFGVAKKEVIPFGVTSFFVITIRTRIMKCKCPVDTCLSPVSTATTPYNLPPANWYRVRSGSHSANPFSMITLQVHVFLNASNPQSCNPLCFLL